MKEGELTGGWCWKIDEHIFKEAPWPVNHIQVHLAVSFVTDQKAEPLSW